MKTMNWLLRREFWEHKGSMFWAPLVVAAILLVCLTGGMAYASINNHVRIDAGGASVQPAAVYNHLPPERHAELVSNIANGYLFVSAPLFLMLGFVVFWYCLGALYDERRDRSILFWKSLPASDEMTVLSKVITAACVTPVITIATGIALSLALLLIACITLSFNGINILPAMLASPNVYLAPLALMSLLPVYIVWALPTIGWLLLVSSWARSKVFLWAVGAPLVALLTAKWISLLIVHFSDATMVVHGASDIPLFGFVRDVVAQGLCGVIPGIWFAYKGTAPNDLLQPGAHTIDVSSIVSHSWMTLASSDAWVGALVGVAMIYGAIRIRRWRDEG
jgi:ABC-2 type transport system permease protein